jgi:FkbM family methyltransferase
MQLKLGDETDANTMRSIKTLRDRCYFFGRQAAEVGFWSALKLRLIHKYNQLAKSVRLFPPVYPVLRVRLPGYSAKLYLRAGTSDWNVLSQVFTQREYAALDTLDAVTTVIDCGANAGYASVYFLHRHPNARIIAVEPDPGNAEICRKNLVAFGDRAKVIVSAVWSHPAKLALVPGVHGQAWATQVRALEPGEQYIGDELVATDMSSLVANFGGESIDILKVDIEGSEAVVFQNATPWLPRIRNIAIELHGADCERIFFSAIQHYRFDLGHSGDVTTCSMLRPR